MIRRRHAGHRRTAVSASVVLGLLSLLSCGEAPDPGTVQQRCSESSDTAPSVVEIDRSEVRAAPLVTAEPTREVGAAFGDSAVQFGRVSDVASGPDGEIYVADVLAHQVLVLDTLGRVRRRIGGRGSGPGEFQGLLFLDVDPADSLRVYDAKLGRVTVFGPGGEAVRTFAPDPSPNHGQIPEYGFDERGRLYQLGYARFLQSLLDELEGRSGVTVRGENTLRRWDGDAGRWVDLRTVASREVYFTGSGLRDAPFGRRPLWGVRPSGGLWYADSGEYVLHAIDASGAEFCRIVVAWPPRRVTEELADRYRSAADVDADDADRLRRIRASRREMSVPDHLPVLERVEVGGETGRVWVLSRGDGLRGEDAGEVVWHVFTHDGAPAFRVRLPGRFRPLDISAERVRGIRSDSLGVERLLVYRLVGREAASS